MKQTNKTASTYDRRKATTPEGRQNQLISAAVNLAEKQLLEGTASSSVIVHYLRLGTRERELSDEILAAQKKLVEAKTEALESQRKLDEMYAKAMKAMKYYHGEDSGEEEEDYD